LPPVPNLLATVREVHSHVQTVVNTQLCSLFNPDSSIMNEKREIVYPISHTQKFLTCEEYTAVSTIISMLWGLTLCSVHTTSILITTSQAILFVRISDFNISATHGSNSISIIQITLSFPTPPSTAISFEKLISVPHLN
ncbi:12857_t:CDS:2, partial [Acaulospora morrowiae]